LSILNTETGTVGRRPSGARLYHRGSRFGPPEARKLDKNVVARILFLAEALDRRTRAKGQHGGLLKAKGLDVLRALLRRFYSYRTGECFPSWDAIAEAAGCCRETVRRKLAMLEQLGIIKAIRRKVVETFTSRAHRVRFDVAVQTSNSYVFNIPVADRREHGDLALPLLRKPAVSLGKEAEAKFRPETNSEIKNNLSSESADALLLRHGWFRGGKSG
jgi:DNA-binding Lrp family transcriptional regulator